MSDVAPADELRELTRRLRAQLRRHVSLGAWAAPGGPTAAYAGAGAADAAAAAEYAAEPAGAVAEVAVSDAGLAGRSAGAAAADAAAVPDDDAGLAEAFESAMARSAAEPAPREWLETRPPSRELFAEPAPAELIPLGRRTLAQIREDLGECTRCKLHTTRTKIVFGVGAEDAPLMFIGEAPGEQEDKRGEPFVGRAGELLDRMIEAMGWTRQSVYIANALKCRPPGNRNPQPDELAQCTPFLDAQIRAIAPRIIVTLGRPAANHVLGRDAPISALRGKFHDRAGVKVMPTFHPAYLLREPDRKKDTWADLKQVIAELERLGITPPRPPRS